MLKSMMYAAILIGIIIGIIVGFISLGLWINAGSYIAVGIAVGLIWISASAIIYCIRIGN